MDKMLSIIIPCFNEKETILELLRLVESADIGTVSKEIIIVDDKSTDGTAELLREHVSRHKLIFNNNNRGKGWSIRRALKEVSGDIVIIQDADLEYNPNNYAELIEPILDGRTPVVYGSRERNKQNKTHSGLTFYAGGVFLSKLTNFLYGSDITDEPTCYKVFDTSLLKSIPLECERFEFCPEVTAKVLKLSIDIVEVPIDYYPRKINEGKKIGWCDGLEAVWTLLKSRFRD